MPGHTDWNTWLYEWRHGFGRNSRHCLYHRVMAPHSVCRGRLCNVSIVAIASKALTSFSVDKILRTSNHLLSQFDKALLKLSDCFLHLLVSSSEEFADRPIFEKAVFESLFDFVFAFDHLLIQVWMRSHHRKNCGYLKAGVRSSS